MLQRLQQAGGVRGTSRGAGRRLISASKPLVSRQLVIGRVASADDSQVRHRGPYTPADPSRTWRPMRARLWHCGSIACADAGASRPRRVTARAMCVERCQAQTTRQPAAPAAAPWSNPRGGAPLMLPRSVIPRARIAGRRRGGGRHARARRGADIRAGARARGGAAARAGDLSSQRDRGFPWRRRAGGWGHILPIFDVSLGWRAVPLVGASAGPCGGAEGGCRLSPSGGPPPAGAAAAPGAPALRPAAHNMRGRLSAWVGGANACGGARALARQKPCGVPSLGRPPAFAATQRRRALL